MEEMKVVNDLNLWVYEFPYRALDVVDVVKAKEYNLIVERSIIDNCDYLIGNWHSLIKYCTEFLLYEMNVLYLKPLKVEYEY